MSEVKLKCPYNYEFGKDYDKEDECETCHIWEKCINCRTPEWKTKQRGKEND